VVRIPERRLQRRISLPTVHQRELQEGVFERLRQKKRYQHIITVDVAPKLPHVDPMSRYYMPLPWTWWPEREEEFAPYRQAIESACHALGLVHNGMPAAWAMGFLHADVTKHPKWGAFGPGFIVMLQNVTASLEIDIALDGARLRLFTGRVLDVNSGQTEETVADQRDIPPVGWCDFDRWEEAEEAAVEMLQSWFRQARHTFDEQPHRNSKSLNLEAEDLDVLVEWLITTRSSLSCNNATRQRVARIAKQLPLDLP